MRFAEQCKKKKKYIFQSIIDNLNQDIGLIFVSSTETCPKTEQTVRAQPAFPFIFRRKIIFEQNMLTNAELLVLFRFTKRDQSRQDTVSYGLTPVNFTELQNDSYRDQYLFWTVNIVDYESIVLSRQTMCAHTRGEKIRDAPSKTFYVCNRSRREYETNSA